MRSRRLGMQASTVSLACHAEPMEPAERGALHAYYERGDELDRLVAGVGVVEFARTKEILLEHFPDQPAVVADIGGGPGRYALWLAELGFRVHLRDVVPLHIDQAREAAEHIHAADAIDAIDAAVGDALDVDLGDASVDVTLLLGPLYHLPERRDRLRALAEARRIVRPGGLVAVAAISRWAARLHGVLADRLYVERPDALDRLPAAERSGHFRPLHPGSFTGFAHRPRQLAAEIRAAGLELIDLVNVEGPTALLTDIDQRMADPHHAAVVLDTARAVQRIPELLGTGPHLMAIARRPAAG